MDHSDVAPSSLYVRRKSSRALRAGISGGRNQLHILSLAPAGDLRALGRQRARGLPLRGESAARDHPRAPAGRRHRVLDSFLAEVSNLGGKLGPLLIQLPPSLHFKSASAGFLAALRERHDGDIVCEPRHESWFTGHIDKELAKLRIVRVAADPARVPVAAEPGGWKGLVYYRLHGSPKMYYSAYSDAYLDGLAKRLTAHAKSGVPTWCIFDNTAYDVAIGNAVDTLKRLARQTR